MKNEMMGYFVFRRLFLGHILELCRTRRKRLYVLPEINPKLLQMKKCFFRKNWGWDQQLEVKGYVFVVKVQFLKKLWKKEDQCTSIFHFADRPEVPYEVDFWRKSFPTTKSVFGNVCVFGRFLEGDVGRFRREFCEFVRILAWNRDGKWWEGHN